jgi:hypothetical protein
MGLIEEVTRMQQRGMSNDEIILDLQRKGIDKKQISDLLSQTSIKNAVSSEEEQSPTIPAYMPESNMEQSVMGPQNDQNYQTQEQLPEQQQSYTDYAQFSSPQQQTEQQYPQQTDYQQYDSAYQNNDNISEIAEQIFDEKISNLSKKIETLINSKTELEAKSQSIDQRLTRMEKIIDRLQLSILQKVGDYLTNVEDIKKELQETQKTFKSLTKRDKEQ